MNQYPRVESTTGQNDTREEESRHRGRLELSKAAVNIATIAVCLASVGPEAVGAYSDHQRTCLSPGEEDVASVGQLMTEDVETGIITVAADPHISLDWYKEANLRLEHRRAAAAELGLHIPNLEAGLVPLQDDVRASLLRDPGQRHPDLMPVEEFLGRANDILSDNYGVTLSHKLPILGYPDAERIDLDDLDGHQLHTLKENILTTLQTIGELPVEYIELSRLERIFFADIPMSDDGAQVLGLAYVHNRGIVFRYDYPLSKSVINHELYHHVDYRICGRDFSVDSALTDLNPLPPENYYTGSRTDRASVGSDYVSHELLYAEQPVNPSMQDVAREYGYTHVTEDKATAAELMHNYQDMRDLDSDPVAAESVLGDKLSLLFQRLYAANPALAEYMIQVGDAEILIDLDSNYVESSSS